MCFIFYKLPTNQSPTSLVEYFLAPFTAKSSVTIPCSNDWFTTALIASVGEHTSLYEPIHGSYPQATGLNIANPLATILSAAMMFEDAFGLKEEAEAIRTVVNQSLEQGIVTEDLAIKGAKKYSTSEVGDWLVGNL